MIVSVTYVLAADQTFNLDYYLGTHIPLVKSLLMPAGMKSVRVLHGTGSPSGAAPAKLIALLEFESLEAFGAAMGPHGAAVMGDVPNFTNATPSIQFNEELV